MHIDLAIVVDERKRRLRLYAELGPDGRLQIRHPNHGDLIGIGLFDRCDRREFGATNRSPFGPEPDHNVATLERSLLQEPDIDPRRCQLIVEPRSVDMSAQGHTFCVTRAADGEQSAKQHKHDCPGYRRHRQTLAQRTNSAASARVARVWTFCTVFGNLDARLDERGRAMSSSRLNPVIPGTTLFDGAQAMKGYGLNKMCYSFNRAEARAAFVADEEAYMNDFGLGEAQRSAVRNRNVLELIEAGGNIYYLAKLAGILGLGVQDIGAQQTGVTTEEFKEKLRKAGE